MSSSTTIRRPCQPLLLLAINNIAPEVKITFLGKNLIFTQSIFRPFSAAKSNQLVTSLQFLDYLKFIIPKSLCKILREEVREMFNCSEQRRVDVDDCSKCTFNYNGHNFHPEVKIIIFSQLFFRPFSKAKAEQLATRLQFLEYCNFIIFYRCPCAKICVMKCKKCSNCVNGTILYIEYIW